MYNFFQNLNESKKKLFHFRGAFARDYNSRIFSYEVYTGPALKLKYQHGEAEDLDASSRLTIGLFFITVCLSFYLPDSWYFKRKCVATWDNGREFYIVRGREYGFYFYNWAFVWSWHNKINESSAKDPWWMRQYIHLDELIIGKLERLEDSLIEAENIWFKLGDKEFVMDSIKWERNRSFRRFIPYSLFHRTWYSVKMDIKKPPMVSGKGENSWDCGDDGTFGLSAPWRFDIIPNWTNRQECIRLAIQYYVDGVLKDAFRYGGSSSERGVNRDSVYSYIGTKPTEQEGGK